MSKCCKRHTNPCMICQKPVTKKNGLQCQGSCKSWIHYTCCKYTPGKVADIKAKIIKVRCPCPDCTPPVLKEELLADDETFSCSKRKDGRHTCNFKPQFCKNDKCNSHKFTQVPSTVPGMPEICNETEPPRYSTPPVPMYMPMSAPQPGIPMPSISVVENMCDTVGLLSTQLNQLMGKMTNALNPQSNLNYPAKPCCCPQKHRTY